MRLAQLSCDGMTLTLPRPHLAKRQRDGESGTFAKSVARGDDLAQMFLNNAIADREAKARALPSAAARKKRLEQMLHHVVGHAAAVVRDDQTSFGAFYTNRHGDCSTWLDAVEPIGNQVEDDLLNFLSANF